jgi:hypothetical protein
MLDNPTASSSDTIKKNTQPSQHDPADSLLASNTDSPFDALSTSPITPISEKQIQEISDARSALFREFEIEVITKFATFLALEDEHSAVRVAGSYNDDSRAVRGRSDVDMIVLSPKMKDPTFYLKALLEFNALSTHWLQERSSDLTKASPTFFTEVSTEADRIFLTRLIHNVPETNVLPCHFLFYKNEPELIGREGELGRRLLQGSRPVLQKRDHTDGIMKTPALEPYDRQIWNIERALADYILNAGLMPSDHLNPRFADHMNSTCRQLVDTLLIGKDNQTVDFLLRFLDPDKGDGLLIAFKPIFDIRDGARYGEENQLQALITPALLLLERLHSKDLQ